MESLKEYVKNRLRERSTWLGIISFLGAAGVIISPEGAEHIIALGVMLAGGVFTVTPDKTNPNNLI